MINLVTSFFNKLSDASIMIERNNEYNKTLISNLESEHIKKIYLFIDDEYSLSILNTNIINGNEVYENKIVKILHNRQATYSDFFKYAYDNLKDEIVMISNSDIYLHSCDINLINKYIIEKNNVFSLSRHERLDFKPCIDYYNAGHDAFIFKSPLKEDIHLRSHFTQNNWGSENLVLSLLGNNGYEVFNPCHQIKIIHNHATELREPDRKRINYPSILSDYVCFLSYPIILDY